MQTRLEEMSWEEFAEARKRCDVAIVPIGSIEQHGPHLPLGTDSMVAIALAEEAARRSGAIMAPPIWYGWSPHHMVLPGTVTIAPQTLADLLYDITASLAEHGIRKFVYINGHRGVNITWIQLAAQRAQTEIGVKTAIFDPAYMSKEIVDGLGFGPMGHADEIETSHMMHIRPGLTRLERAIDNPLKPAVLSSPDPRYRLDTLCYQPSTKAQMLRAVEAAKGTTGSPSASSKEKGGIYHSHLVRRLLQVIESL